jgi:hypothetical protein
VQTISKGFRQRSETSPNLDLNGLISLQKQRFAPRLSDSTAGSTIDTDSVVSQAGWRVLDEFASDNALDESKWTTVMIRNIPHRYTQEQLLQQVMSTRSDVDFLHLPMVGKSKINMGYAFANFSSPDEAFRFMTIFDGHKFAEVDSGKKPAAVNYAKLQGLQENIAFYESRRISNTGRKPWVKKNGN